MYNDVNLDVLSEILDIALVCPPDKFDMEDWISPCGTTHCLLGNYLLGKPDYALLPLARGSLWDMMNKNNEFRISMCKELGLSTKEFAFLFTSGHVNESKYRHAPYAMELSQKEALTRLAKFIIYKRKKREVWTDYEKARRTEGTNFFCNITQNELDCVLI